MTRRIEPLANAYITVYASDVEKQEFVYTPRRLRAARGQAHRHHGS